jgi:predicted MFS family arabinose efflux permease
MSGTGWRGTLSALCAILVGIGLARFAYTPLIPALVEAQWFTPAQAAYLGAANLAGYLAGALLGRAMAARIQVPVLLRGMMLAATISFFACAYPLPFAWFFLWRFASGVAGAVLMVLAAPSVLPHVPAAKRGLAGGVIALTVAAWGGWPRMGAAGGSQAVVPRTSRRSDPKLTALYLEYALNAVGVVPHMVFLVDFIARGLERGVAVGAWHWVLFGVGASAGPVLAGTLADRIGFGAALRVALIAQAICVGSLAVWTSSVALAVSCVVVGAFMPGSVSLVLGRVRELAQGEREAQRGWTFATLAFAVGQAIAAYGFSFLFGRTGSYALLFAMAAAALALALVTDLAVGALAANRRNATASSPGE